MSQLARIPNNSTPQKERESTLQETKPRFRWWHSALLVLTSLCVTLVLLECVYRVFLAVAPKPVTWSDRPARYYKPEASKTLQDYAYAIPKPEGTFRIAVIGDSFTFAPYMQFDDAFPKRLERMLNLNKESKKVEVMNYGVPGFSTSHEVISARQATKEGADLILLQITLNDPQLKPYRPTGLVGQHQFGNYEQDTSFLRHWKSLQFVLERLHNSQTHRRYQSYYFDLFKDGSKTRKSFEQSLGRFAKLQKNRNIPVVAVVFPLFGVPLDDHYPFHSIHQIVNNALDSLEIPALDLFSIYQGIPLSRIQVIPGADFHPNEIGHRMAAEEIYSWLISNNHIPQALSINEEFQSRTDIRPLDSLRIKQ